MKLLPPFLLLFFSAALCGLILPGSLRSYTAPQATFNAVSIKPDKSGDNRVMLRPEPGGRFLATNATVEMLLNTAYQLKPHQLIGAPSWITSEHFDIEARAESSIPFNQMRPMLQAMLADRFKLAVHHETRQVPQYSLGLVKEGKLGPKLVAHSDDVKCVDVSAGPPPQSRPGETPPIPCGGFLMSLTHMAATRTTLEALAGTLSNFVDRPVVDRTGLTGFYDVEFDFTPVQTPFPPGPGGPAPAAPDSNSPPLIFTALQEQLGLKLKPETAPGDVLVIDHVEEPSPN
jgi:uncharacterized protein (TIGR03435 family)